MRKGKFELLGEIVERIVTDSKQTFSSCVVTNERGLIVAGKTRDGSSSQTLAAMLSLLSDTAARINDNLGYGHPRSTTIKSLGVLISSQEFLVAERWFRIGAIITENNGRFSFFRKSIDLKKAEAYLGKAAERIRTVLEAN